MWSHVCEDEVKVADICDELLAVGCKDGWLYLFDEDGVLWTEKLSVTFYRDPYTDVQITALDVNEKYLAVGTNFMDGKLYLFSKEGDLIWKQQFMTVASIGERPEDVTSVSIGDKYVGAGAGWIDEFAYIYNIDGNRVLERAVEGAVRGMVLRENHIAFGTERRLYIVRPVNRKFNISVKELMFLRDGFVISEERGLFMLSDSCDELFRVIMRKPEICVDEKRGIIAAADEDILQVVSPDGEVLWRKEMPTRPLSIFAEDEIYLGFQGRVIVLSEDRRREIKLDGEPICIGRLGVAVKKGKSISLMELP